jgi:putative selenium metabolism protein SsnA
MTDTTLLGNGIVVTAQITPQSVEPRVVIDGAVAWKDDRILRVGPESDLRREFPDADFLDARGGLIVPGLINLHHHFYSALARGLDPRAPMHTFGEVLDRLWWRLDRALELETVSISAQLSAADCIRSGCTTVFDHHASPSAIAGSLDVIADAIEDAGLSAALCYEITDRNGHEEAVAGLEENLRFVLHRQRPRIRGILGLHASFTLRDETMALAADRRTDGMGCHIHLAEDPIDISASKEAFGAGPVERIHRFGLLDSRCLLAHGIHLTEQEYRTIAVHDAVVIHNPESNANNGVGHLNVVDTTAHGCLVGLGTDGMSSAVLRSLRFAFLTHRGILRDPSSGFEALPDLLSNNVLVARRFFEEPLLGELAPDAPADVIVLDAPPPTAIGTDNTFAHLVYGASEAPVRHTIARGRILFRDFLHTAIDTERLAARAREASPALWDRFHALPWGTSFLGT